MALENSIRKLLKLDFSYDGNLLPGSSVNIGLKSTSNAREICNFPKNAKVLVTEIPQKHLGCSPLRYPSTFYMSALSLNQTCSISDEMLINRFEKLLETLLGEDELQLALLQSNISSSLKMVRCIHL